MPQAQLDLGSYVFQHHRMYLYSVYSVRSVRSSVILEEGRRFGPSIPRALSSLPITITMNLFNWHLILLVCGGSLQFEGSYHQDLPFRQDRFSGTQTGLTIYHLRQEALEPLALENPRNLYAFFRQPQHREVLRLKIPKSQRSYTVRLTLASYYGANKYHTHPVGLLNNFLKTLAA